MSGLGDDLRSILLAKGWVEPAHFLLVEDDASEDVLAEKLMHDQIINGDQYAEALAIQHGLEHIKGDLVSAPEVLELVELEHARLHKVLPLFMEDGSLVVALANPLDLAAIDELQFMTGLPVLCKVASREQILKSIVANYGTGRDALDSVIEATETDIAVKEVDDGGSIGTDEDDAPVIRLVEAIITNAVKKRASDIHIESMEDRVRVRYRIDGKCVIEQTPPKKLQGALFGRIKLMARMDIAEKRKPQDGPIKIRVLGKDIDLRVSTLPSSFGESVVMRILDKESIKMGVEQLGFHPTDMQMFNKVISRPNGIVLVTGPTGSGKTTTLYAALNERNRSNIKIITAEDPVEYNVSGINQIQVNHTIGLNFKRILRAMLRQAPNIILVGEIRDYETAEIAIEASLTGHLVFSTLHTNDAPASITRLIDMGVKPYLVSSALIAVLAQRLVRVICKECKAPYHPEPSKLLAARITAEMSEGREFFRGEGCPNCNSTGYRGRLGIYELLAFNTQVRDAIFHNRPTHEIREIALKNGMHTLAMDGVRKVFSGVTTVEEVLRVAKAVD